MAQKISQMTAADTLAGSEQIEVSQLSTTVTITAATISAAAADNSFNDSGSGFVAAGFAVGSTVKVTGFTGNVANNIFSGTVTALTAAKMTIGGADGDVIVDDAAGESVTITMWVTRRSAVPTGDGNVIDAHRQLSQSRKALTRDGTWRDPSMVGTGALTVGSISTITDDTKYNAWPLLCRLRDSKVFLYYTKGDSHHGDDTGNAVGKIGTEGLDGAITWGAEFTVADHASQWVSAMACTQLSTGRILATYFRHTAGFASNPLDGAYLRYSDDAGTTWSAEVTINSSLTSYSYTSGGVAELENGNVLVLVEGQNSGDTHSRMRVLTSSDAGLTWGSEIDLASSQGVRNYYEGTLRLLSDGSLLSLLRTTDGDGTTYYSKSTDSGATWSAPATAFAGHAQPNFVELSTGTLIAISRKNEGAGIGDAIAYTSGDKGATWGASTDLDTTMYEMEYGCPIELLDGRILVVYGYQVTSALTNADIKQVYITETKANASRRGVLTLTDGATISVDAATYDNFRVVLGGNRTLANPSNLYSGQVLNIRVHQDGTGSRTLAYGTKYKFAGGPPTLSTAASAKDFISCQYDATDDTLYCAISKAMA